MITAACILLLSAYCVWLNVRISRLKLEAFEYEAIIDAYEKMVEQYADMVDKGHWEARAHIKRMNELLSKIRDQEKP